VTRPSVMPESEGGNVAGRSGPWRRSRAFPAAAIASTFVVAVVVLAIFNPWANRRTSGPSNFAPVDGPVKTAPGTIGCRSTPLEVCYSVVVSCLFRNFTASNLYFAVTNETVYSYPEPNNVPLGPDASVSVLQSGSIAAVWNWSTGAWSNGSGWLFPYDSNVTIVLDTGLVSDSTMLGMSFWVEYAQPYGGSVGFFFH
jgi:hypothetical protein